MAFPEKIEEIKTNLPKKELIRIMKILDTKGQPGVKWTKSDLFIYWCDAEFTLEGKTYEYKEEVELCTHLLLKDS